MFWGLRGITFAGIGGEFMVGRVFRGESEDRGVTSAS